MLIFSGFFWGALLVFGFPPPPPLSGVVRLYGCVGACLSLGATFVGVTQTYHHTGRSAGPWIRILVVVVVVVSLTFWSKVLFYFIFGATGAVFLTTP